MVLKIPAENILKALYMSKQVNLKYLFILFIFKTLIYRKMKILSIILLLTYIIIAAVIFYKFVEDGEFFLGIIFGIFWPVIYILGRIFDQ